MSIGTRIVEARLPAGFRFASDLARAAGVSKQYLHNLEHDLVVKPDPAKLALIARALRVDLDWLATGAGLPGRAITPNAPATSPDAGDVLDAFTHLGRDQQRELLEILQAITKLRKKQ